MSKLYLHFGYHKTGSSSFQKTCAANIGRLHEQGIKYPLFSCAQTKYGPIENHSMSLYSCFCSDPSNYHINQSWGIKDVAAINRSYLNQFASFLQSNRDVVISGEDLSHLTSEELLKFRAFVENYDLEIIPIAILRSPYSFSCSATQEGIKGGYPKNFTTFVSQVPKIQRLMDCFPETLHFAFSEVCKNPLGPVGFLLDYMGVDHSDFKINYANTGSSNLTIRLQNELNLLEPWIKNGKPNQKHKKATDLGGEKFYLTPSEFTQIEPKLKIEEAQLSKLLGDSFLDLSFPTSSPIPLEKIQSLLKSEAVL